VGWILSPLRGWQWVQISGNNAVAFIPREILRSA
jgi:hypothetical protein